MSISTYINYISEFAALFGGLKYDAFHPFLLVDVLKPVVLQELTMAPQEWQFCCWETCLLCRKPLSGTKNHVFLEIFPSANPLTPPPYLKRIPATTSSV